MVSEITVQRFEVRVGALAGHEPQLHELAGGVVDEHQQGVMSHLLLGVMGAVARFEREQIRERQREGIAIAKREGKYRGRKPSLTPARAAELRRRVVDGDSKTALAREFGISRDTLYRYVPVKKRRAGKLAK
jgi:DNA invertase Pin-like site-specific DNA recombinase